MTAEFSCWVSSHNDIVSYYKAADCVLIPSVTSSGVQEATSIALLLEGMSCGKAVICTNVGGLKEVVTERTGIIVGEKDPAAISQAIGYIMKNRIQTEEMGTRAREYALENHSYQMHARLVTEVYRRVLGYKL